MVPNAELVPGLAAEISAASATESEVCSTLDESDGDDYMDHVSNPHGDPTDTLSDVFSDSSMCSNHFSNSDFPSGSDVAPASDVEFPDFDLDLSDFDFSAFSDFGSSSEFNHSEYESNVKVALDGGSTSNVEISNGDFDFGNFNFGAFTPENMSFMDSLNFFSQPPSPAAVSDLPLLPAFPISDEDTQAFMNSLRFLSQPPSPAAVNDLPRLPAFPVSDSDDGRDPSPDHSTSHVLEDHTNTRKRSWDQVDSSDIMPAGSRRVRTKTARAVEGAAIYAELGFT